MRLISKLRQNIVFAVVVFLSGCSTYPAKFKCHPTQGAGCVMLSEVDRQIDSGEIELAYENEKCKGKKCKKCKVNNQHIKDRPEVASQGLMKVKLVEDKEPSEYRDAEYWYIQDK